MSADGAWVVLGAVMRLHTISYYSIRYRHYIRQVAKVALRLCVAGLFGFGAYCFAQPYVWAVTEAQNAVERAEAERDAARLSNQELLQVLEGRMGMEHPVGTGMVQFAKVTWTLGEAEK